MPTAPQCIANLKSHVIHARGCNHLPPADLRQEYSTLDAAKAAGHKVCAICFRASPRVSGYGLELRLGEATAGSLRQRTPQVVDPELNARVSEAGQRVLASWPVPLRGYQYKFGVVDDDAPNAVACPAGRIYVTTGLLDAVEDDAELDAVLAHEITHVERRHGYRQYRRAQTASVIGGIASILIGAAAEKATKSPSTGSAVADVVRAMADIATVIALTGYGRSEESEADSYALAWAASRPGGSSASLVQMLSKLKYAESKNSEPERGADLLSSHPQIDDRISKARATQVREFAGTPRFAAFDKDGNVLMTVELDLQAYFDYMTPSTKSSSNPNQLRTPVPTLERKREVQVFASVETSSELAEKLKIRSIVLTSGGERYELDNREDTELSPVETAGMNFSSSNGKGLLPDRLDSITVPGLSEVGHWERVDSSSD